MAFSTLTSLPAENVCATTSRTTAIDEALSASDSASHVLLTRVMELQDRLAPVLMPVRPACEEACGDKVGPPVPPLASRVKSTTARVMAAVDVLSDIADRLEL